MKVFRVFPYDPSAADQNKGGALFVPSPSPLGRIANLEFYRELYFADRAEAAVAEKFGFLQAWHANDFIDGGSNPFAVTSYEIDASGILNLNDTAALVRLGIDQPSQVVTRNRELTQNWAKQIFMTGRYSGLSWWSYYYPDWTAFGVWNVRLVRHVGPPEILTPSHPAVLLAANTIVRQVYAGSRSRGRR
jgi:hypothetical protein